MSKSNDEFDRWYEGVFGSVLGSEDADNRDMIKTIWNGALAHVAQHFEHDLFEEYSGNQVADKIRSLMAVRTNHDNDNL